MGYIEPETRYKKEPKKPKTYIIKISRKTNIIRSLILVVPWLTILPIMVTFPLWFVGWKVLIASAIIALSMYFSLNEDCVNYFEKYLRNKGVVLDMSKEATKRRNRLKIDILPLPKERGFLRRDAHVRARGCSSRR